MKEWQTGIETQIHFNELIIRNRTLVITIGTAFIAGIGAAIKFQIDGTITVIASVAVLIFFGITFLIDYFYYFRLLKGAVKFTSELDEKLRNSQTKIPYFNIPLFGLTDKINEEVEGRNKSIGRFSGLLI